MFQFFPEANEVTIARHTTFEDVHEGDYLTKPSLFKDSGVTTKVKMAAHLQPSDDIFLVAYPYFNVNGVLFWSLEFNLSSPYYVFQSQFSLLLYYCAIVYICKWMYPFVRAHAPLITFNGELETLIL
jgi:hypothetical protein